MSITAADGDNVVVHYTGKLDDGSVFDSSKERDPLEFTLGAGQLIPGFEQGVLGMKVGETREVKIAPEDAYGERSQELIRGVEKQYLPKDVEPEVGMQLQVGAAEELTIVTITDVQGDTVMLDANHPLAGKTLNFSLELLRIE